MIEFLLRFWKPIAGVLGGLVALLTARQAGKNTEKRKAAERALEAVKTRRKVEDEVGDMGADERRDSLAEWVRDNDK